MMNSNRLLLEIANTRSQIEPNQPGQGAIPKLNMQLLQRKLAWCVPNVWCMIITQFITNPHTQCYDSIRSHDILISQLL